MTQKLVNNMIRNPQEDFYHSQRDRRHFMHRKESRWKTLKTKSKTYLRLFLKTSSIHGLSHLVAKRRHPLETFLWLQILTLSMFGSVYLSRSTWTRYQYSPTVVSMDRDMFAWNTTFPCVTICTDRKLDQRKVDKFVALSPEPDKEKLESFIKALANATFANFDTIPDYSGIPSHQYMDLILNLSINFNPTVAVGAPGVFLSIIPTITEMGLCYAANSKVAQYNSPAYRAADRWDWLTDQNMTFFIHPLDGEVFAQIINMQTSYNVYIHGPWEVPDIATKLVHSAKDFYMKLYVTAVTVYTSPDAARLSVSQKRCRFPEENNLEHNAVYSYNMCRMECRIKLSLEYCQCIPHFYRRIGEEKVCDVRGLHCLAKFKDELYKLIEKNGKKINCDCYPLCDDVNYVIQSNVSAEGSLIREHEVNSSLSEIHRYLLQEWYLGTNLQWGIVTYPRLRYRREIIFGFTDVLVAVGGMAGLFLGCSVLSFMEIVYFLTLRLFCYAHENINK